MWYVHLGDGIQFFIGVPIWVTFVLVAFVSQYKPVTYGILLGCSSRRPTRSVTSLFLLGGGDECLQCFQHCWCHDRAFLTNWGERWVMRTPSGEVFLRTSCIFSREHCKIAFFTDIH